MDSSPRRSSKELHSGDYVTMYEKKPISRVANLVPRMKLDPETTHLADFACGNAMLLEQVDKKVLNYVGIDFSQEFVEAARRRAQRLGSQNSQFYCSDIVDFCAARPDTFDVATALDFSEHVNDEEFVAIFSAIRSSMKPGGSLYLHTPNLDFFLEKMRDSGLLLRQRPEHIGVRNAQQHMHLLGRAGFDPSRIRIHFIPHYNVLRFVHPFRHLPGLGKFFEARLFIECVR